MHDIANRFGSFWPQAILGSRRDRLVACIGAGLGVLITEWLSHRVLGTANPWFIASMGASALLMFAVPASPMAQPWTLIGGNLVSGLVGVSCAQWIENPDLAAAIAIALSIGAMYPLRCLHPPGGAVAITTVLGGPGVSDMGYHFVLSPVLLNSLLLLLLALLINRMAGRSFPHRVQPTPDHATTDRPPSERVGVSRADLHAVLSERGELPGIFLHTEMQALDLLQQHRISALPVTNAKGEQLCIVPQADLVAALFRAQFEREHGSGSTIAPQKELP